MAFNGNTAAQAYWMTDTADIATHNAQISGVTGFSAPPAGHKPFTYAYNNYDINYNKGLTENPLDDDIWTVKFVDHEGALLEEQTVEHGNPATPPANPQRHGFHFTGWHTEDGTKWDFANPITDELTLYTQWEEHDEVETIITPTCTEDGLRLVVCGSCGEELEQETLPALGHDLTTVVVEPTCTEKGHKHTTCSRCDYEEYEDLPALGHDLTTVIVEPTCTEDGHKHTTCNRCDYEEYETLPALGHDLTTVVTEPTCTEKGHKHTTCSRCDYEEYEDLPALGHDLTTVIVEPTCTEEGHRHSTCSRCGYEEYETLQALGHDWDGGSVTTPPTPEEDGVMTFTCRRCGVTHTEPIPYQKWVTADKSDAYGIKIPSNAHSYDAGPGIVFYWDQKQKDEGVLEISPEFFETYTNLTIVVKSSNEYRKITLTTPGTYDVQKWLDAKGKEHNINMVWIRYDTAVRTYDIADFYESNGQLSLSKGDIIIVGERKYMVLLAEYELEYWSQNSLEAAILWWTAYLDGYVASGVVALI
jgi:uncharacterized repeat protein (TIGR02543 family)